MDRHRITTTSGESFVVSNEDQQKILELMMPSSGLQSQKFGRIDVTVLDAAGGRAGRALIFLDHITSIVPD